jgi:hypothetical protein
MTGILAQLAERRAWYIQGSGFEPDIFHKAYYMPFSCRWRFEMKLRIFTRCIIILLYYFAYCYIVPHSAAMTQYAK